MVSGFLYQVLGGSLLTSAPLFTPLKNTKPAAQKSVQKTTPVVATTPAAQAETTLAATTLATTTPAAQAAQAATTPAAQAAQAATTPATTTPQMPQMPESPQMPAMPESPDMPEMPESPEMPEMPDMPGVKDEDVTEDFTSTSTSNTTGSTTTSSTERKICDTDMILNIILFALIIYVLYLLFRRNSTDVGSKDFGLGGLLIKGSSSGLDGLNNRVASMYPCDMY